MNVVRKMYVNVSFYMASTYYLIFTFYLSFVELMVLRFTDLTPRTKNMMAQQELICRLHRDVHIVMPLKLKMIYAPTFMIYFI